MSRDWTIADRISDKIVNVINDELDAMRQRDAIEPLQLLAGELLALHALAQTVPAGAPESFKQLMYAAGFTLGEIMRTGGSDG